MRHTDHDEAGEPIGDPRRSSRRDSAARDRASTAAREWPSTTDLHTDGGLAIREPPVILIPVEVLEGETIPDSLVEFLAPADVILLGYHVLPEQTPAEQASMQFGERAQAAVEDIAHSFVDAGEDPETRVVFTHDRDQTISRIADELGATAILLPNPTGAVSEILVPIRGVLDEDRLADLVATLADEMHERVTLWGLTGETSDFDAEAAVADAAERLQARGVTSVQLTTETATTTTPIIDIVERSAEADVVVMGEGSESPFGILLGDDAERVAEGAVAPVLVVRDREPEATPALETESESETEPDETTESDT
jgi:nucleotide-binding universal stress UspA family protein